MKKFKLDCRTTFRYCLLAIACQLGHDLTHQAYAFDEEHPFPDPALQNGEVDGFNQIPIHLSSNHLDANWQLPGDVNEEELEAFISQYKPTIYNYSFDPTQIDFSSLETDHPIWEQINSPPSIQDDHPRFPPYDNLNHSKSSFPTHFPDPVIYQERNQPFELNYNKLDSTSSDTYKSEVVAPDYEEISHAESSNSIFSPIEYTSPDAYKSETINSYSEELDQFEPSNPLSTPLEYASPDSYKSEMTAPYSEELNQTEPLNPLSNPLEYASPDTYKSEMIAPYYEEMSQTESLNLLSSPLEYAPSHTYKSEMITPYHPEMNQSQSSPTHSISFEGMEQFPHWLVDEADLTQVLQENPSKLQDEPRFVDFSQAKSHTTLIKKPVAIEDISSHEDGIAVMETVGKEDVDMASVGLNKAKPLPSPEVTITEEIAEKEDSAEEQELFPGAGIELIDKSNQKKHPSEQASHDAGSIHSTPQTEENHDPATVIFPTPSSKFVNVIPHVEQPKEEIAETTPLANEFTTETDIAQIEEIQPSKEEKITPLSEVLAPLHLEPSHPAQVTPMQQPLLPPLPESAVPPRAIATPPIEQTLPAPSGPISAPRIAPPSTDTPINAQERGITAPEAPHAIETLPKEEVTVAHPQPIKEISVNFNNVAIVEFIRFISRISNKNFIFDEADLQFTVTIVSEEATTIENLMASLLQELKIRDFSLIEQGNNIIVHRNPRIRAPAHIVAEGISGGPSKETELVTQVFRLNTLDPNKASEIIRPLLSDDALVEVLRDSNNLILTDLVSNVNKISQLINSLDAPNSGMTIGQYAVRNAYVESLAVLAEKILLPIAQGNPFVLVPHQATNSIFIVSNPFIVERALAILENLDMNEGRTKIFSLEQLRLSKEALEAQNRAPPPIPTINVPSIPLGPDGQPLPPLGIGAEGAFGGIPPGFLEGGLAPGGIISAPRWMQELPLGHIERTLFFIYKLKFRRGDQIELALRKIGDSLMMTGTTNQDLVAAINSTQWLEASNSLIFTGTALALDKVRELVEEIDIPLRQVFIEMLILDTTITDSLSYGVEWGSRFGGGDSAGAEAFLNSPASALNTALDAASVVNPAIGLIPNILARAEGFTLGVVGRHLTHDGTRFNSIGALVRAVHTDGRTNIIMNPKIITEDNNTAEIFVGFTNRFKTQSISNDIGSVITNNFQFIDVGTTLRVTPLIGNNDIITLEIIEEITNGTGNANPVGTSSADVDVNLVPVLSKNRTLTRVHVPDGFFVVLSGMIQETDSRSKNQIPCLGGIPIIGGISKTKGNRDDKRNLMIFIRPVIIDTDQDLEDITKRQQDIYREKTKFKRSWNYEIDEALDFLNIKPTDPDEIGCTIK